MQTEGVFGQIESHYPTLIRIDAWAKSIGMASLIPYSSQKKGCEGQHQADTGQPRRNLERKDTQHILTDLEALPATRTRNTGLYSLDHPLLHLF